MTSVRHNRRRRGAALVETVLVAPLLVTLLLISMYVTDLLRAKLKLQEAARYAVWEMTSYRLSDYAQQKHARAFEIARDATLEEARERFSDLDSVDVGARLGMAVNTSGFTMEMTQLEVQYPNGAYAPGVDEGWASKVNGLAGGGFASALDRYGFNRMGRVQVEVGARVDSTIMPDSYLDGSGGWYQTDLSAFQSANLKNRYTMVVDGWDLPDGADAQIREQRAGMRAVTDGTTNGRHGLYDQVHRMTYLGDCDELFGAGMSLVLSVIPNMPLKCGTHVVAHNYMAPAGYMGWRRSSDCGYSTYPTDAAAGLNNLQATSELDYERTRCYDTAPFRDTWTYGASGYLKMFRARGSNFMGCEQAQADNPAEAKSVYTDDENDLPVACLDGNDFE